MSKSSKFKIREIEIELEAERALIERADNFLADWLISLYFRKREVDSKDFGLYNHHCDNKVYSRRYSILDTLYIDVYDVVAVSEFSVYDSIRN